MTYGPSRRWQLYGALIWALSWTGLALEIFRWHHVTPALRLNPPPPPPGTDVRARPGGFLIAILVGSVAGPLVFAAATGIRVMNARAPRL